MSRRSHRPGLGLRHLAACAVAAVVCLGFLLSCSTAPRTDGAQTGTKTQAAQDASTGDGYLRQGRYVLALQFYTQALSEYTSIDDEVGIVTCYNAIGRTYMGMGSLDMAADMFARARDRSPDANPSLRFVATNNLGELALVRGDAAGALSLFQEALAMPAGARTDQETGILYHNLGTAQKNLGNFAEALSWYQKSLDINLPRKLIAEAASDYYMIASVHSLQGSFDDAVGNAQKALTLDKQIENSPGIAQDLYALGLIARKRGDLPAAFDWFQRSYLVYTTLASPPQTRKVLADLIAAADTLGRTQDADAYRSALAALGTP